MILIIDNYDSFTYNLVHYLGELGAEVVVKRNDALGADEAMALGTDGLVFSPGPCDPDKAGICLELIGKAAGRLPMLGVCLGHQAIGQAFGAKVVRGPAPMHGKLSDTFHHNHDMFEGIPSPFRATRYHSLILERDSLPDCLEITAETEDGVVMGLAHRELPVYGVQFHPESFLTLEGPRLLANFLGIAYANALVEPAT